MENQEVKIEILPMTHYFLSGEKMPETAANVAYAGQIFEGFQNGLAVWVNLPDGRAAYFGLSEVGTSFNFA